jgi:uncharacterized protein DUF1236
MRIERNTLLAGIAALALVAGTGFASAQEPGKDQNGAQGRPPHAATQQMNKGPAVGKMGQNAQNQNAQEQNRTEGKIGRSAQEQTRKAGPNAQKLGQQTEMNRSNNAAKANAQMDRRKEGAMVRHEGTKARTTAQQQGRTDRENTAQDRRNGMPNTAERQRNGFEGLQGNASGMNVQLNDEQRTQIRTTVIEGRGAPRVGNVNFDVTVGTVIPRGSIHIVPVPETLVRIEPAWRGFLYFVYQDEVVIVSPRDMRIVAVVNV